MRDDEVLPVSTPTSLLAVSAYSSSSSSGIHRRNNSSDSSSIFGHGRYKFWALAAILMLAFWSMLTGTVTLRWSAEDLQSQVNQDYITPSVEDLDVLDLEEREKLVRHMWDVYTNIGLMKTNFFYKKTGRVKPGGDGSKNPAGRGGSRVQRNPGRAGPGTGQTRPVAIPNYHNNTYTISIYGSPTQLCFKQNMTKIFEILELCLSV
ncbi:hypothetical protein ACS0TY_017599 [Phlomoides rotata]